MAVLPRDQPTKALFEIGLQRASKGLQRARPNSDIPNSRFEEVLVQMLSLKRLTTRLALVNGIRWQNLLTTSIFKVGRAFC